MSYSVKDLLHLMTRLRDPESGCPWDREQTYSSLVKYTLEEVYEVVDTLEREDWPHLQDELGDLLFQIVFYAEIAKESSHFQFEDIIHQLVEKLIRRHPHVFPDGQLYSSELPAVTKTQEDVQGSWEEIKRKERAAKLRVGVLDEIPLALPALPRAVKLQKRAASVGFDWTDIAPVFDKIEEELAELKEAIASGNPAAIMDEMGDLLFAQVNLSRHLKVDPETALRSTNRKFERRFRFVETQVEQGQGDWHHYTLSELDHFWNQAKQGESPNE